LTVTSDISSSSFVVDRHLIDERDQRKSTVDENRRRAATLNYRDVTQEPLGDLRSGHKQESVQTRFACRLQMGHPRRFTDMRKILLLLAATATLAFSGAAAAATATVTITKAGYVPSSTTIAQGDSVQFLNSDTVVHQVTFKSTKGVTCTPNPVVLQPTQTGTCTFATAGSYTYSDPNVKGNTFKGSVTVTAAAESISLAAAPRLIAYGGNVTLSGTLSTHKSGENLDVLALQCGSSAASKVMTVQTTTNGAFTLGVKPLMNTTYTVKVRNTTSNTMPVSVRPKVRIGKIAPHRYNVRVNAAQSFAGKYVSFQRYNGTRWISVKTVLLAANSTGVAPTMISGATFRSTVKAGLHVRVVIGQAQVGACYLPGISNTILS
jgi:plastocyanin